MENDVENEELDLDFDEVEHTTFDSEITDNEIIYAVKNLNI